MEGKFPFKYLRAPIVDGRLKAVHFEGLLERIRKKLAGWKNRLLSQGGRLVLLKHVLTSMPIHLLSVIQVAKLVIRKINNLCASFFWGETNGVGKRKWRS